jgi:hypothetical protein
MRLATDVYWIDEERPVSGASTIQVRRGKFFRYEGDTVLVLIPSAAAGGDVITILTGRQIFTQPHMAEACAVGLCIRAVEKFKYDSATAYGVTGEAIYTAKRAK